MEIQILDQGYVRFIESWGSDERVIESARMSTNKGFLGWGPTCAECGWAKGDDHEAGCSRPEEWKPGDEKLLRFLWENRHCYLPDMQVLTARGWVRWDECESAETFLVPDPKTRMLRAERLDVEAFDTEEGGEEIHCFENDRMSYRVTADHRMWFKPKYQQEFGVHRAREMQKWGHFDPLRGYSAFGGGLATLDPAMQFVGFYLGDGSYSSKGTVTFHLRKKRKQEYLTRLIAMLSLACRQRPSSTCEGAIVFTVETPRFLVDALGEALPNRTREKCFPCLDERAQTMSLEQISGLRDGLINSDGHLKEDRPQVEFSSTSPTLLAQFELLSALLGEDAHGTFVNRVTAFQGDRSSLEARKQYFSTHHYEGKVYCATTSTGFLMVRGAPDEFAFVCGNSTPFEMAGLTIEVKAPIFVFREWHRHRTQSYNEMSARYTPLPDENYMPTVERCKGDPTTTNRQAQGTAALAGEASLMAWLGRLDALYAHAQKVYEAGLALGIPKEVARLPVPVARYSRMRASTDLRNWLGFLTLRMAPGAQVEIRQYANAVGTIVAERFPRTWELFAERNV